MLNQVHVSLEGVPIGFTVLYFSYLGGLHVDFVPRFKEILVYRLPSSGSGVIFAALLVLICCVFYSEHRWESECV
jgi:hypothetical protein